MTAATPPRTGPRTIQDLARDPPTTASAHAAAHDVPQRLEELQGVGPQLAASLRRHFRSDDAFFAAARRCDLPALVQVEGVSERKAADLVRQVNGGGDPDRFLATPAARKVHDEVLERLASHCATSHGRNRLRLLAPLPTIAEAEAHARTVMAHRDQASRLDREAVRKALRRLRHPTEPKPRRATDRIVVCETEQIQERLEALGAAAWVHVAGMESLPSARGYDTVLFLYEDGADLDGLDNVLELPGTAGLAEVAPERTIAWFEDNRALLEASVQLATLFQRPHRSGDALAVLAEAQRAQATAASVRAAVAEGKAELEAALRARLSGISLRGDEILQALGSRTPPPLQKAIDACLGEARERLQQRTGLSFQPFTAPPVEVDEEEVERVEQQVETRGRLESLRQRSKAALKLEALRPLVQQEIMGWLDFDAAFALGCFALEHDLRPARFGEVLECRESVHLELSLRPDAQRIAYRLGGEHPVAVLTGANSGGKTTLLEHLAQLVIMARLGLPVVGDATVPWVDELHYVTNRRSLDAGAFESFLRSFLPLADGTARRLVLADEVESMTELEAAGRILGFFLDRVAARNGLTLLVTHMADEILRHTTAAVRVDGIEATGLDERFQLVVDRAPRMGHRARSTPELIVQRIAATARGPQQELYRDLLARFRAPGRKTPSRPAPSPPA